MSLLSPLSAQRVREKLAAARLSFRLMHKALADGFWHVIEDHYTAKGYSTRDLERHIIGLINDRYLKRGYAI